MRVSRSKHDNVNMPKAEDEGRELTKDYGNSPLHRFKVSRSDMYFIRNICLSQLLANVKDNP